MRETLREVFYKVTFYLHRRTSIFLCEFIPMITQPTGVRCAETILTTPWDAATPSPKSTSVHQSTTATTLSSIASGALAAQVTLILG